MGRGVLGFDFWGNDGADRGVKPLLQEARASSQPTKAGDRGVKRRSGSR